MIKTHLLPGLFKASQEKGKRYLHDLEVDRLLAPCYEAAGLKAKSPRYGGWEEKAIAGHSLGHFLSAAAFMVNETGDKQLEQKMIYAIDELDRLQAQDEEGYVSGFPKDCFSRVFTGTFQVDRFSLGDSWVPWYSIHKIFAGLVDVYNALGYEKALRVATKLADWAKHGTDKLTDEQFQKMLYCEFGGMNEVMAELYEVTGKVAYLELAKRFCHKELLDDLSECKDNLEGKHANTQIPKVLGAAKLYTVTGEEQYKTAATFFWDEVVAHRSYVIGGNSRGEHFGKTHTEPLGVTTAETCNTYNMLKLSAYLFEMERDSKYMDYYEKALYNHILASQDPESGMKTYFMSTEPGHFKVYCDPEHSFWCCTGSGMENPARYHQHIYTLKEEVLYVNLYMASQYINSEAGFEVIQESNFPYTASSRIVLRQVPEGLSTLAFRVPAYLNQAIDISINGAKVQGSIVKGYAYCERLWKNGDVVEIGLPMELSVYESLDDESKIAFLYGPIVLAAALGTEHFPESDIQKDHTHLFGHPGINVPVLVTEEPDITQLIQPVDEELLHFKMAAIGQPGNVSLHLIPFFELHHQRYSLYLRKMTPERFQKSALTSPSYQENLQKITIDYVAPHQQQPEIDHHMKAIDSYSDYALDAGLGWREAKRGGAFSYQMKVLPNLQNYLCATYWGSDTDLWTSDGIFERNFDIRVDDEVIGTEVLKEETPSMLYDIFYEIPMFLTKDKEYVKITFQSKENTLAGRVFGVRTTRERL